MARSYHHGDLRRAVMAAALEQLAENDSVPLNFRQLGQRLGVSHSAIYRHFADKQALIDALAQHGFELLNDHFAEVLRDGPQATAAGLARLAKTYVHFALEHPVLLRVMFSGVSTERKALPELKRAAKAPFDKLMHLVHEALARGELRSDKVLSVGLFYWSALHGLAELLAARQLAGMVQGDEIEALIAACVEYMLSGTLRVDS